MRAFIQKVLDTCQEVFYTFLAMDAFDVRYRFALNPLECVADGDACHILRAQEFPYRPWRSAIPPQDKTAFWDDLSEYLREKLSVSKTLAQRLADFLVGYLLVIE